MPKVYLFPAYPYFQCSFIIFYPIQLKQDKNGVNQANRLSFQYLSDDRTRFHAKNIYPGFWTISRVVVGVLEG